MKIAALPAIPTESVASGAVLGVRYWHWMDSVLALVEFILAAREAGAGSR